MPLALQIVENVFVAQAVSLCFGASNEFFNKLLVALLHDLMAFCRVVNGKIFSPDGFG